MPSTVCGVRVMRQRPHFANGDLYYGHEWVELLDADGEIEWSAGFWPAGMSIWGDGSIYIPDEYEGRDHLVDQLELERTAPGLGTAFGCDERDCDAIRRCIIDRAIADQADPPTYSVLMSNCRHWVTRTLTRCCIIKGAPIDTD